MQSTWGAEATQFFYSLTPDKILTAFEKSTGLRATGRNLALNSMENRVYEIEIEREEQTRAPRHENYRILKFYRPGRWSAAQIAEEHQFLAELVAHEIPVVAPEKMLNGETIGKLPDSDILFTVFRKAPGRSPDELMDDQLAMVGRLLARLHNVGAAKKFKERAQLTPTTYGLANLEYLLSHDIVPADIRESYGNLVTAICSLIEPLFKGIHTYRIHGDCHFGNILWGEQGPFWVDFDDCLTGPAVQDLWLVVPGRDEYALQQRGQVLEAYEQMRPFDRQELQLIEPLRALRFIHFTAWIARRWEDPAFPRVFPYFGSAQYWRDQVGDLREQLSLIREQASSAW